MKSDWSSRASIGGKLGLYIVEEIHMGQNSSLEQLKWRSALTEFYI